jgi:hypothetical protein
MPWNEQRFPTPMQSPAPWVRYEAIAIAKARQWAEHHEPRIER